MKNKLLLVALIGLLTSCGSIPEQSSLQNNPTSDQNSNVQQTTEQPTSEEDSNDVDVIVLAGQSNAEGNTFWNPLDADRKVIYASGFDKTLISYEMMGYSTKNNNITVDGQKTNRFEKVTLGQAYDSTRFGPEVGMAEKFQETDREKPVYIVKFCSGGTSLFTDWRSPTTMTATGSRWNKFIPFVDGALETLMDQGYNPVIKALCWMQGESDSNKSSFYELYENNFINDFNDYFVDFGDPEEGIKFIDAGISDGRNPEDTAYVWDYTRINQAKINNQARDPDNRFYIDTIAAGLKTDPHNQRGGDLYHYDAESMVKLGYLFADVLLNNNII